MKKLLFFVQAILFFQITWSQSESNTTYTHSNIATGINSNTDYLLQLETEKRMKDVFKDFKLPPKYVIPTFDQFNDPKAGPSQNQLVEEGKKEQSLGEATLSPDPKIRQQAYDARFKKGEGQALQAGVGQPIRIPYDKSMDKFLNGVYGYNPNLTIIQNEEYYNKNGYNISYKIKGTTIFIIGGIILLLIIIGFAFKSSRDNYYEKFKTQN